MKDATSGGAPRASTVRVAVDTGGTFTDLLVLRDGRIRTLKVPSTPDDPAQAVLDGLARALAGDPPAPFALLHGSTVATNALLERAGARVVLVANEGFEDVLEIGRQNRPQLYALVGHRPPPLVPRERRLGLSGRLGPDGAEVEALDPVELEGLAGRVAALGPDAVAVCLLHAYADPRHEEAVAGILESLDLPCSVSSRLLPEFREYERTSTTVVNAYVAPVMSRYLGRLAAEAGAEHLTIMGSNGGALPVERARREAVHTVLSGPAGGVMGALDWSRRAGFPDILTFDMGGTSTDVSLCPGEPLRTREFTIDSQPVAVPVLDIHTVGAGGGSLASMDAGGALRVGPRSAGARPGPIAYGRGGNEVTVTDAHVWLGHLPTDGFLGGDNTLDRAAVEGPLQELARGLGLTPSDAAEGVLEVANTAMERALRVISVERGYDPAGFTVVAFGGAGGLHVAELTRRLGAARALIPPDPGLLSAYGMLASPVSREASRTLLVTSDGPEVDTRLDRALDELEKAARAELAQGSGTQASELRVLRHVDARYRGQSFELRVPRDGWVEAFHRVHAERYGYRREGTPVEAVTVRVEVRAPTPEVAPPGPEPARGDLPTRTVRLYHEEGTGQAQAVWRRELGVGHELTGPAIVQEYSATTWVPEGWRLTVHPSGCLVLEPRPES